MPHESTINPNEVYTSDESFSRGSSQLNISSSETLIEDPSAELALSNKTSSTGTSPVKTGIKPLRYKSDSFTLMKAEFPDQTSSNIDFDDDEED
jgi:hypothetical protein